MAKPLHFEANLVSLIAYLRIEAVHHEREHERLLADPVTSRWPRTEKMAALAVQRREWIEMLERMGDTPKAVEHG